MNDGEILVRKMAFDFPNDMPVVFIRDAPEDSFLNAALSLLLPYLEPYLIRTMKAARPHVSDERLAHDLDQFVGQEGQHYRQHMLFNQHFHRAGYEGLKDLELEVEADYRGFSADRPLGFNLAYAEGFEALTSAMACAFTHQDTSAWHPSALDLFQWHLIEELEHRCVAFDVYEHVVGRYLYRLRVGFFAQRHLLRFMDRATKVMLRAHPEYRRGHYKRMFGLHRRFFRDLAWPWLRSFSPGYNPRNIPLPARVHELAARYTSEAVRVS